MKRIRFDLTDDLCVEAPTAPALFTFTYNGSRAFIVSKGTLPGDVCELRRSSIPLSRMVEFERYADHLFRCVITDTHGRTYEHYFDAANVIRNVAMVEEEMDVVAIRASPDCLAVF
jgi:hypothetical protein